MTLEGLPCAARPGHQELPIDRLTSMAKGMQIFGSPCRGIDDCISANRRIKSNHVSSIMADNRISLS